MNKDKIIIHTIGDDGSIEKKEYNVVRTNKLRSMREIKIDEIFGNELNSVYFFTEQDQKTKN